jgi:alkaline phosphatase D
MNFLREPKNSPRRKRDGVYTSYVYGKAPHRVQLILMDLRWFRSHLKDDKDPTTYLPEYSPSATMLGEEQWRWLEAELQKPAEVRVIGSSTQFLGAEHRFEKWANMPLEKDKLLKLIDRFKLKNTFVISGDMHFGEITRGFTPAGQEIVDLTSSGLNRFQSAKPFPNSKRFGLYDTGPNFGLIGFDWAQQKVVLELRKLDGGVAFAHTLKIESLSV